MLNPSIGKLLKDYENHYQLVLDVAHKAREISAKAEEEKAVLIDKPVDLAINKLAEELHLQ